MIQRIQSVWLFLASIFNAITFRFPFFVGDWQKDDVQKVIDLNAQTTLLLTIITVVTGLLALVNIFLFSNRKLQLKLTYGGLFLSVLLLVLYFLESGNFNNGDYAIWSLFYAAIFVFYLLAARGIRKDEKLIKSLDRLR
jgi:peptidoglycan/LPS O-acetylase OafA/YrhL